MVLSHQEVRAFYDRFGSKQDWQRFYEDPATQDLIDHADFEHARSVLEFGCGTGRFAQLLLEKHLPPTASYVGLDVSTTMIGLSRKRLGRFADRAEVRQTDGRMTLDFDSNSFDRFVSNYVFDILSADDIRFLLAEAHRVLEPDGLIGLVCLTHGFTTPSRLVVRAWKAVYSRRPRLLGGCRPIELLEFLPKEDWNVLHRNRISRFGLSSEILVARKEGR